MVSMGETKEHPSEAPKRGQHANTAYVRAQLVQRTAPSTQVWPTERVMISLTCQPG